MVYWVFNQAQIERALEAWLRQSQTRMAPDTQRTVLDFLFSEPVKQASLINGVESEAQLPSS
jgi:hypothetical protein